MDPRLPVQNAPSGWQVSSALEMTSESTDAACIMQWRELGNVPPSESETRQITRLITDTMAIAIAARKGKEGATAHDMAVREPMPPGECDIWGAGGVSSRPLDAAFLNGCAAEVLDYQEVLLSGRNNGHAAVVIVPALAGLVEANPATAPRLLSALRAAFLTNISLMNALGRGHRAGTVGFRTTSLGAPVAAALGGACLLGLETEATINAVGIAACALPAGLLAAMAPSMGSYSDDKDLAVGYAAAHSVDAVRLAAAGCRGPSQPLSGPRGWLASYGFGTELPDALQAPPEPDGLKRYAIKRFPANFGCQSAIRAALDLAKVAVEKVESVEIRVKSSSATSLATRSLPNPLAARFSLPYAVSSALVRNTCRLEDFEPEALTDSRVLEMMERCTLVADDALEARHQRDGTFPGEVTITLSTGERRSAGHGGPWDGLEDAEIDLAFDAKLDELLGRQGAASLKDHVAKLADGQPTAA